MAKIRVLFLLLPLIHPIKINGQGIKFSDLLWNDAFDSARQNHKLIFIDAYAIWCMPCKRMNKEVFPDKTVGDFFNKRFISIKYNIEKGYGKEVRKQYHIDAVPTLLFFNSKKELLLVTHAISTDQLIKNGETAIRINQYGEPLGVYQLKYNSGSYNLQFIIDYIHKRQSLLMDNSTLVEKYLELCPEDSLKTLQTKKIVYQNNTQLGGKAMQYILNDLHHSSSNIYAKTGILVIGSMKDPIFDPSEKIRRIIYFYLDSVSWKGADPVMLDKAVHLFDLVYHNSIQPAIEKFIVFSMYYSSTNKYKKLFYNGQSFMKDYIDTLSHSYIHFLDSINFNNYVKYNESLLQPQPPDKLKQHNKIITKKLTLHLAFLFNTLVNHTDNKAMLKDILKWSKDAAAKFPSMGLTSAIAKATKKIKQEK